MYNFNTHNATTINHHQHHHSTPIDNHNNNNNNNAIEDRELESNWWANHAHEAMEAVQRMNDFSNDESNQVLEILKQWFIANIKNPYPTETDLELLSSATKLDPAVINSWFIETRRNIWKPFAVNVQQSPLLSPSKSPASEYFVFQQQQHNVVATEPDVLAQSTVRPSLREDILIMKQENDELRDQILDKCIDFQKVYRELAHQNGDLLKRIEKLTNVQHDLKERNKMNSSQILSESDVCKSFSIENLGCKRSSAFKTYTPYPELPETSTFVAMAILKYDESGPDGFILDVPPLPEDEPDPIIEEEKPKKNTRSRKSTPSSEKKATEKKPRKRTRSSKSDEDYEENTSTSAYKKQRTS
jgi:hypothetical protein